jgi:sulfur relay (sulfurtransferase) complex TusBCD TusD component (DsrE family)
MARYLVIESRNAWESADVPHAFGLVKDLATAGHDVTVFLVQNGVMPARKGAKEAAFAGLVASAGGVKGKVRVLADDFSLRERGIEKGALAAGVEASSLDEVVDLLASGVKAIWH